LTKFRQRFFSSCYARWTVYGIPGRAHRRSGYGSPQWPSFRNALGTEAQHKCSRHYTGWYACHFRRAGPDTLSLGSRHRPISARYGGTYRLGTSAPYHTGRALHGVQRR
jgi:hypothetical protein